MHFIIVLITRQSLSSAIMRKFSIWLVVILILGLYGCSYQTIETIPTDNLTTPVNRTIDPSYVYLIPTPDPNTLWIAAEIKQEASQQEIAKILFTKWLDHFLSEKISPEMRLDEYKINSITISDNQICIEKLGAYFISEAEIIVKTTLPVLPTTSQANSHWMTAGGGIIAEDTEHITRIFNGAVFKVGNIYTLRVITAIPIC